MALDYSVNTKGLLLELTQEFLITYILTFVHDTVHIVDFVHTLWNLCQLYILTGIFVQPIHIGHIIIGLNRAACETGQFQVPMPKPQHNKPKKDQQ